MVWKQIIGLLEDDRLIQSEIERRRELAQTTNPSANAGKDCGENKRVWKTMSNGW